MDQQKPLLFLHGLEGSSQGVKATLLRNQFPHILTPDLPGTLEERMARLAELAGDRAGWTLIGSSFGGLMAALFARQRSQQVERMILLAPALIWPDFAAAPPSLIHTPTIIYHGRNDTLIPLEIIRPLVGQAFSNLVFYEVDDDHGLYKTAQSIDWPALVYDPWDSIKT